MLALRVTAGGVALVLLPVVPAAAEPLRLPPRDEVLTQGAAAQTQMSKKRLGSITSPTDLSLRKRSKAPVTVRLRMADGARVSLLRVNGVDVTDRVVRTGRTAVARLGMKGPLKVGANGVLAEFTREGRRSFDASRFTLTRSVTGLIHVSAPRRSTVLGEVTSVRPAGPVRVKVRVEPQAHMAASLNGRAVTKRFAIHPDGTRRAQLGPSAGLRYGKNVVKVRALTADGQRQERSLVVRVASTGPLADAGPDKRTDTRHRTRLDGRKTKGPRTLTFNWRITKAPKRAKVRLKRRASARPVFAATTPGTYVVSNTVRSGRVRSTDKVTVSVSPSASVQPVTMSVGKDSSGQIVPGILVGTQFYPSPVNGPGIQMLVLERATLALSSNTAYPPGQMADLQAAVVKGATQGDASDYLYVLVSLPGGSPVSDTADLTALVGAVQFLGFQLPDPSDADSAIDPNLPFQLVGIPDPDIAFNGTAWSMPAALDGVFTPDVNNNWTFNTGDYAPFDTGGTAITIGSQSWPLATGNGFQVVVADPISLDASSSFFSIPAQVQQMGQTMQGAAAAGQVVAIRSVGTLPDLSQSGSQADADGFAQVTGALQEMGGSPSVFMGLGPGDTYSFVGPTQPYSFPAEASTTIAGDGTVTGQLFRVPQGGGYAPMAADPTGNADFASSLSSIAVQPAVAWPKSASAGQQASLAYLSQKLAGGIGCDVDPCDVRTAYDDVEYQTQWTALVSQLAKYPCSSPNGCRKLDASRAQFKGVRKQLAQEFSMVDDVWELLGSGAGIQAIYSEVQGATVGGLDQAFNAVDAAVAPKGDPATTTILSLVTDVMWAASILDVEDWALVATVAGALAVAAATANDLADLPTGSPYQAVADAGPVFTGDILGQLTVTMEGVGLLGQFIVQDWGRLSATATQIDTAWTIDSAASDALSSGLVEGAVQNMYSALMPVAYQAWALTPAPETGQVIGDCYPGFEDFRPWKDVADTGFYLDQVASPVSGVEPDAGLRWYAWWEAGKNPKGVFDLGSPPPASLTDGLYQPFSFQNMQYAGLFAPWFWGRTYLGSPAPVPGVLTCKYRQ